MYRIETLINGRWCQVETVPIFLAACKVASRYAEKYGDHKVRIVNPFNEINTL